MLYFVWKDVPGVRTFMNPTSETEVMLLLPWTASFQQEEEEVLGKWGGGGKSHEFKNFVGEKTNCTVLQHPELEADDLIAGWIQSINDNLLF